MTTFEKRLINARPSLRVILPVVYWQTLVYSILNFALGLGIYLWNPTVFPLVAPNVVVLHYLWGPLFFAVGIALVWGLVKKYYERLRAFMMVGLLYKFLWSISLIFGIHDGGTFLVAALFIGLAALQAVVIIFYLPPDKVTEGERV